MKMRYTFGLALLCVAPLLGEDEGRPGPPPEDGRGGHGRRPMGDFIRKADANGDGKVSREEFDRLDRLSELPEEKRTKLFSRLDRNDNGSIEGDELKLPPHGFRGPGPLPDLRELDENKDRAISFEEFVKGRFVAKLPAEKQRKFFDRLDTDKDGRLTPKDHRPRGGPGRMFRRLDDDDNGALTFEEFVKAPWISKLGEDARKERFEKLDANGDEKIRCDEWERGNDTRKGPPPPPPGGGPPPAGEERE